MIFPVRWLFTRRYEGYELERSSMLFMGKLWKTLSISMAIFESYVRNYQRVRTGLQNEFDYDYLLYHNIASMNQVRKPLSMAS